jgi:hypothetical protein
VGGRVRREAGRDVSGRGGPGGCRRSRRRSQVLAPLGSDPRCVLGHPEPAHGQPGAARL